MNVYLDRHTEDLYAEIMFGESMRLRPTVDYGASLAGYVHTVVSVSHAIVTGKTIALPESSRHHEAHELMRSILGKISIPSHDDDTSDPSNVSDAKALVLACRDSLIRRVEEDQELQHLFADHLCREAPIYWIDQDEYVRARYYIPKSQFLPNPILKCLFRELYPWFAAYCPRVRRPKLILDWIDSCIYSHVVHGAVYASRRGYDYLPSFTRARLFSGAATPDYIFVEKLAGALESAKTRDEFVRRLLDWRARGDCAEGKAAAPANRWRPVTKLVGAALCGIGVYDVLRHLDEPCRALGGVRVASLGWRVLRWSPRRRSGLERIQGQVCPLLLN